MLVIRLFLVLSSLFFFSASGWCERTAVDFKTESRFDQWLEDCINLSIVKANDSNRPKDAAEACEKIGNLIKMDLDARHTKEDAQRLRDSEARWERFGWIGLTFFNVAVVILVIFSTVWFVMVIKSHNKFLYGPDDGLSFSRVVGFIGMIGIAVSSYFFINFVTTYSLLFGKLPDGSMALISPIFTFVPSLLPYVFAKREEGSIARARIRSERAP